MLTRWNSSWRECGKCSHRWLFTATPRFFSSASRICLTSGPQPPQLVAALVCFLQRAEARAAGRDRVADRALGDAVARADQRRCRAAGRRRGPCLPPSRAGRIRSSGCSGSGMRVEHHLQQRAVVGRVADQDRAEQLLAVARDHQLLVDAGPRRCRRSSSAPGVAPCASPIEATSTPISLSLVLMSAPRNCTLGLAGEVARRDLGHLVAGRDQAEDASFPQRALADRVDVGVGGPAVRVDARCRRARRPRGRRRAPARRAAGCRRRTRPGRSPALVPSANTSRWRALGRRRRSPWCSSKVDADAERFDLPAQQPPAGVVELHRHQARRELDDVRLEAEVLQRLRRLQAEQPAADHRADLARAPRRRRSLRGPRSCGRRSSRAGRARRPAARTG